MNSITCIHCGLANAPGLRACRQCGKSLAAVKQKSGLKRLIFKSLTRILFLTLVLLFLGNEKR